MSVVNKPSRGRALQSELEIRTQCRMLKERLNTARNITPSEGRELLSELETMEKSLSNIAMGGF
jgi:hypothetical protein